MLRIYLVEDVDVLLGRLLNIRGFDCTSAPEEGHLGSRDEQHLDWASAQQRIIISHNRVDFEKLARKWWNVRDQAGIVLAVRRADTYELLRRVLPVLNIYDQSGWRNTVMYA